MQRDYKLSSYSLNSVSAHFLSEQVRLLFYVNIIVCMHPGRIWRIGYNYVWAGRNTFRCLYILSFSSMCVPEQCFMMRFYKPKALLVMYPCLCSVPCFLYPILGAWIAVISQSYGLLAGERKKEIYFSLMLSLHLILFFEYFRWYNNILMKPVEFSFVIWQVIMVWICFMMEEIFFYFGWIYQWPIARFFVWACSAYV